MKRKRSDDFRFRISRCLRIAAYLSVVAAALILVSSIASRFGHPSEARITEPEPDRGDVVPERPLKVAFNGPYYGVDIPGTFVLKRREYPGGESGIVEQSYWSEPNLNGRKLAIVIERMPRDGIRALTAYRFRESHTETYSEETLSIDFRPFVLFRKPSPVYELTAFVSSAEYSASISLTSADIPPEKLMDDFSSILTSFKWGVS